MPKYTAIVNGVTMEILAGDELEAVGICQKIELAAKRVVLDADRDKYQLIKLPDKK